MGRLKIRVFLGMILLLISLSLPYAHGRDCTDLEARLKEAESALGIFAEGLADCSEELAACEKRNLVITEGKKALVQEIGALVGTGMDLEFLFKLSEEELKVIKKLVLEAGKNKKE